MKRVTIAEHTIAPELLSGGCCIDVGCRGFEFALGMVELGCKVLAFDIEDMESPHKDIEFRKAAVLDKPGKVKVLMTQDPQARHISTEGVTVDAWGINILFGIAQAARLEIDVLKLDCEGSEYRILSAPDFQPVARQITVEFHEHAHKAMHDELFPACMHNLIQYYEPVQHIRDSRYGAGFNFWDSLFVRRDLI